MEVNTFRIFGAGPQNQIRPYKKIDEIEDCSENPHYMLNSSPLGFSRRLKYILLKGKNKYTSKHRSKLPNNVKIKYYNKIKILQKITFASTTEKKGKLYFWKLFKTG